MSLQRHAAPVEQFQQMQASLRAEIQSAQPVRIGISVRWYRTICPASKRSWTSSASSTLTSRCGSACWTTMPWRTMGWSRASWLDAGLVIDLGCAAPVLARTTLRADPGLPAGAPGAPLLGKERIPLAELRGQRVLLPSLRQDLFSPLWAACARAGFAPNAEIGPSFLSGLLSCAGAALHLSDPL